MKIAAFALALALLPPLAVAAQERPTVDVYIRSQAGLPPSSARGEIEVVQLGGHPLDKVLSIVGHRTAGGWRVSYVCAQSPACDPKRFLLAKEFDLKADAAMAVDVVLDRLRTRADEAAAPPTPSCGQLAVAVDDRGFKRRFRACSGAPDLSELESLLKAGLP